MSPDAREGRRKSSPPSTGENHMKKHDKMIYLLGLAVLAIGAASTCALAAKLDGAQYLKDTNLTLIQARAMALKAYGGKIVTQELEKESGGSGLRYSFVIKNGAVSHEVGIDAQTGKLLENSVEGPNAD